MTHYYINAHYSHSKDAFENFAQVEILFSRNIPSERTIRKQLRLQHNIEKPIRSLEWMYEEETA